MRTKVDTSTYDGRDSVQFSGGLFLRLPQNSRALRSERSAHSLFVPSPGPGALFSKCDLACTIAVCDMRVAPNTSQVCSTRCLYRHRNDALFFKCDLVCCLLRVVLMAANYVPGLTPVQTPNVGSPMVPSCKHEATAIRPLHRCARRPKPSLPPSSASSVA